MANYFYKDTNKKEIRESLLTDKAKAWAESFIYPKKPKFDPKLPVNKQPQNPKLNSTQLRKFHIEAKGLEERAKNLRKPEDFPKLRPLVKMLKSKVAYACPKTGRGRKVPDEFRRYIEELQQ